MNVCLSVLNWIKNKLPSPKPIKDPRFNKLKRSLKKLKTQKPKYKFSPIPFKKFKGIKVTTNRSILEKHIERRETFLKSVMLAKSKMKFKPMNGKFLDENKRLYKSSSISKEIQKLININFLSH